ncbi:MAG TPA: S8 family serine peptidase [Pyrinomonadaceae bacterium]|nr:S8 family serine peptidase [Pyrinomonadaceae bacterium]
MFRVLRYVAATAILAALLALPYLISTASITNQVSVIVELRDEPAAVYKARTEKGGGTVSQEQLKAYRDGLAAKQADFLKSLSANGISAAVVSRNVNNFDGSLAATVPLTYSLVYNGMALTVDQSSIAAIRKMPQVKSVHSDEKLTTNLNNSVPYIRAPQLYGKDPNDMTPFATMPDGNEGQGVYVAIIDTGIDWTHPMFGGDPTPPRLAVLPAGSTQDKTNKKVVYYLPLTDSAVEDGFGHGTHVASTVAGYLAQPLDGSANLHGVAPQAKLMSYKVCSDIESTVSQVQPIGGCDSSNIIMALEDAVSPFTLNNPLLPKPIAGVINMSLGGGGGPDNPTAIAASNAALAGTVVVAASGNSGPGEGTTGSPAAGVHVISVGATTHPGSAGSTWSTDVLQASAVPTAVTGAVTPASALPANPAFSRIKLYPMAGTPPPPAGAFAQHYVYVDNPTGPWPAAVSGRIALVNRSGLPQTPFAYVSNMAAASGAVGVIFVAATQNPTAVKGTIPSANVSPADGQILIKAISSSDNDNPANGAISELPIRMQPFFSTEFMGEMAGFSSRGPVKGLGQVKPDISAPGVQVLAACPPASLLGALAAVANPLTPNYIRIDGTSMATPHTTGAVALIKEAHPDWSPDVVRAALINTATNMRNNAGSSKADGPDTADSIIAQGGGLIDVYHAVYAKALMGVTGDGIAQPGILGSYSYGQVPVVNNRITSTQPITVTVRDMSGEGGIYNLNVANNRDLQLAGISVATSQSSVSVPANGTATFTVNATFNGDQIRDVMAAKTVGSSVVFENIEMQWYVTAQRADGKESLRMPFYFKPGPSLPASPVIENKTQTATVPAASAGNKLASGVDYVDVPMDVPASTYKLDVSVEWFERPTGSQEDIDYELLDPDGNVIASSGNGAGTTESVNVSISRGGTYTHRLIGFTNAATDVTIASTLSEGPAAPAAQTIPGDFIDAQSRNVDFDGTFTLNWTPVGGEQGFEIEQSSASNPDWTVIADVAGNTASYNFTNLANDSYSFRVRGIQPGQIGKYVTNPGNAVSVLVATRSKVDITSLVSYPISNVSFAGGVWQQDVNLVNNTTNAYVPFVDFNVVGITSATGTVRIINADNSQNGTTPANAAQFSFTNKLGADQIFDPAETSGSRTVRFQDSASEMFSWDVQVTAYVATGGSSGASSQSSSSGGSSQSSSGSLPSVNLPLTKVSAVMRFTANPLTKTVTSKLISLK